MKTNKIILTILLIVMANIAMAQTKKEECYCFGKNKEYYVKETYIANDQYKGKADESPILENLAVEYSYFSIPQRPQKIYKGVYKDNKPYDGFFVSSLMEELRGVLRVVQYYEKAVLIAEYTNYVLGFDELNLAGLDDMEERFSNEDIYPIVLDRETTYEKDQVKTGYQLNVLKIPDDDTPYGIKAVRYENFGIKDFFIDLYVLDFDINNLSRVSFSVQDKQLLVKSSLKSSSLHIKKENNRLIADYFRKGKKLFSSADIKKEVNSGTPNSLSVFYLDQNNNIQQESYRYKRISKGLANELFSDELFLLDFPFRLDQKFVDFTFKLDQNSDIKAEADQDGDFGLANEIKNMPLLNNLFMDFPFQYDLQPKDFMEELAKADLELEGNSLMIKLKDKPKYLSTIAYDKDGKIASGIIPTKMANGSFQLAIYDYGERLKTETYKSIEGLLKAVDNYR